MCTIGTNPAFTWRKGRTREKLWSIETAPRFAANKFRNEAETVTIQRIIAVYFDIISTLPE
jgi:hypothetical protein